jgi:catechol 2,3-dioxygenase-like lactoylglutathione lyase family enzyme
MKQSIVHVALVVREYDDAIRFYTEKLKFTVIEDTYQPEQDKRWVLIAPPGSDGSALLLAGHRHRSSSVSSATRRAGESSFSSALTISGEIITE